MKYLFDLLAKYDIFHRPAVVRPLRFPITWGQTFFLRVAYFCMWACNFQTTEAQSSRQSVMQRIENLITRGH